MKIFIKFMVSARCKTEVKSALKGLGLHYIVVDLGEVEIMETLSEEQRAELKEVLHASGLELMDDKRSVLIGRIKELIVEMVRQPNEMTKVNFSDYLSEKLQHDYAYLSGLFSEVQGITIEHFMIAHKIEQIKELIMYDELNISQIAWKLNYSSVAHLSNQFKKATGLSPSHFRQLKLKRQNPGEGS